MLPLSITLFDDGSFVTTLRNSTVSLKASTDKCRKTLACDVVGRVLRRKWRSQRPRRLNSHWLNLLPSERGMVVQFIRSVRRKAL